MNITATVLLAFGMSMDAFAASIGKGATLHKPKFSEALRTGLIFGAVETLTPLIGWGMGMLASRFVLEWNHWIAFVLLIFLGGRMIIEGFRGADDEDEETAPSTRFLATGNHRDCHQPGCHGCGCWSCFPAG
ncbi:inner membrane protein [Escherichia coli]|uniref:Inner membrane protein n=1 Tax=Escherichia coli TaxID=562 RepID=A0A377K7B2_ECOLX|nr:inner membrane protein [Escherichia coli]